MFRRTIALALAGMAIAAPPALADHHHHHHTQWHSLMKPASDTASRSAGGCTVKPGWRHGSLIVSCNSRETATFVYVFPLGHDPVHGTPTSGVSAWGRADIHRGVKVASDSLRMTVTVTDGMAQLSSVNVGYYA
jgi:hypothetical protein